MGNLRTSPVITCSWCGTPVLPKAARMRLHESESVRVSGNWLATFHPDCGDALLDLCETNARALALAGKR
jgi:hypothetical protein